MNELVFGAWRQLDVLKAVMYREALVRFGRRSLGLLEEIGSIAVHIVVFSLMRLYAGVEVQHGLPVLPFVCVGIYNFWLFRTGISQIPTALSAGSYRAFSQVTPLDVALARGAVNMLLYIGLAVVTFWLLQLFGYSGPVGNWTEVILILVANGIFGIGCGLVLAGPFHYLPFLRTVVMIGAMRILSLIDGTFFLYPDLPPNLRPYAIWIPNLHLNDMAREAYFPSYQENWTSLTYVTGWIGGSLLLGLMVERALRNAIEAKKVPA
ncbi:ABC transporter permease [Gluconacetobacter tumulisoli]|uniref:Uncharacterized protein n=1 Tax=Gluconacetobacter tumulisoli TaxID=1286189 RepID=A0A7W4K6E3_9PROT|nr:hypothetical protein [Gluconacetobacter tumulisoli]MBB2201122.1 hypothetical protein [Gluconacetobacter tumulisoli]